MPQSRLLGDFLRARRESLRPLELGLPQRSRRRTPGLRREEVAQLCGISPTWYTWIEQGRTAAISPATLVALSQGLQLTQAERAYLFEIAGRVDPAPPAPAATDGEELAGLVQVIRTPAYVLDRYWNALAWNRAAAQLFRDWLSMPAPNLLRYVFLQPRAKTFLLDWEERARRLVAEFRADMPRLRDDPQRSALVEQLSHSSREFAAGWRSQRVLARDGGRRSFRAGRGVLHFEQHILRVVRRPDLRITVLVPVPGR
ncbi:MAG TPA: helix-turn-helix transcriptional regulator [Steroidobacteraceae bacterium]|jgi:transcriptional regulator with XRE-family HTH domain|nr:helix-turn-helix transcriptional regulator [Steroidobacteraceae bacterium]